MLVCFHRFGKLIDPLVVSSGSRPTHMCHPQETPSTVAVVVVDVVVVVVVVISAVVLFVTFLREPRMASACY